MSDCGSCTMCCKVMQIEEIAKPYGQWCKDCKIGVGCGIYESRPQPCRDFECLWLHSQKKDATAWPIELRPDHCHVVMVPGENAVTLHVDPARPDAWKSKRMETFINKVVGSGARVFVAYGSVRKLIEKGHG